MSREISSLERRMVGQEMQSGLGILSLEGLDTDRPNREPDRAHERTVFFPSAYLVNPVRSDGPALNEDGVCHDGMLPDSEEGKSVTPLSIIGTSRAGWRAFPFAHNI
jgi:hypothetical protein